MVKKEKTAELYFKILKLLENEAAINNNIYDLLKYLLKYKEVFTNKEDLASIEEQKELLRLVNRYSDEFKFSEINYSEFRNKINELYDYLNSERIA